MRWRDIKIRSKLFIGFGAVLGLLIVIGWLAHSGLTANRAAMIEVADVRLPSVENLLVLKEAQMSIWVGERGLLNRRMMEPSVRREQYELIDKAWTRADKAWSIYAPLPQTEEEARVWQEFIPVWEEWKRQHNDLREQAESKDRLVASGVNLSDERIEKVDAEAFAISLQARIKSLEAAKLLDRLIQINDEVAIAEASSAKAQASNAITLLLVFAVAAVLIGALVAFFLARNISQPLQKLVTISEQTRVEFDEVQAVLEAVASNDLTRSVTMSQRVPIEVSGNNEIGELERAFEGMMTSKDAMKSATGKMTTNLRNVIAELTSNAAQLASASTEIASTSEQMARGSTEQTNQTTQVSSAVEEMTATIVESSKNATEASNLSRDAAGAATEGTRVVAQTIDGMSRIASVVQDSAQTIQKLAHSSDQIGEIISVIDDIADQTNLLALNAAIEAARAGEQGRGFAVVADEVRKLAERTTKATKEITDMIKGIQAETKGAVAAMDQGMKEVEGGRHLADKAGESLNAILNYSQRVQDMITQIASAAEQQSAASEQIARNVEAIAQVTRENATGVEQSASAAEELNRQAEGLQQMVGKFHLDGRLEGIINASGDHIRYMGKLRDVFSGKTRTESWSVVDSHNCRFGKWYFSHGMQDHGHRHEFKVVQSPHESVHRFANEAVTALRSGDRKRAEQLFHDADKASKDVLAQLQVLKQVVLDRATV